MQKSENISEFDRELFIKRALKKLGFKSQRELADMLGTKESTITRIKKGDIGLSVNDLIYLAKKAHCTTDYLLGLSNDDTSTTEYKYPKILDVLLFLIKSNAINVHGNFEYIENVTYEDGSSGLEPLSTNEQKHLQIDIVDPILNYLLSDICDMYSMVQTGQIKENNFITWLKGRFSEFDYQILPRYFTQAQQYSGTKQLESIDNYDSFIERVAEMIAYAKAPEHNTFVDMGKSYCDGIDRAEKELEQSTSKKEKKYWKDMYDKALEDELNKNNHGERIKILRFEEAVPDPKERAAIMKEIEEEIAEKTNKKPKKE